MGHDAACVCQRQNVCRCYVRVVPPGTLPSLDVLFCNPSVPRETNGQLAESPRRCALSAPGLCLTPILGTGLARRNWDRPTPLTPLAPLDEVRRRAFSRAVDVGRL